jgi:glyoxylase-like metal-dependent hydrolase (beta-lactamase superfamily II)
MAGRRGFSAGGLECVAVSDGEPPFPPAMLFGNASPEDLQEALGADHLGGLVVDREPVFATARHIILRAEWEFWTSTAPESVTGAVEQALRPLHERGLLELAEDRTEVAPGVRLVHAPGHTPGHVAVELGDPPAALFLADAVLHEAGFQHPESTSPIDSEPELAVETRRTLLARATEQQLLVAAYHLGRHLNDGRA